jgi:hypothetical protein
MIIKLEKRCHKMARIEDCVSFQVGASRALGSPQTVRPYLVHLNQRSMGTIAITWRPSSVNFSHFKLLRNYGANWNQT